MGEPEPELKPENANNNRIDKRCPIVLALVIILCVMLLQLGIVLFTQSIWTTWVIWSNHNIDDIQSMWTVWIVIIGFITFILIFVVLVIISIKQNHYVRYAALIAAASILIWRFRYFWASLINFCYNQLFVRIINYLKTVDYDKFLPFGFILLVAYVGCRVIMVIGRIINNIYINVKVLVVGQSFLMGLFIRIITYIILLISIYQVNIPNHLYQEKNNRFCIQNPNTCKELPEDILGYISRHAYQEEDYIKAIIQTYKGLSSINKSKTKQQYNSVYGSIIRAIQCLEFVMPDLYDRVYEDLSDIQINDVTKIRKYLQMLQHYTGQVFRLTAPYGYGRSCSWPINQTKYQSKISSYLGASNTAKTATNTTMMINVQAIAYGPFHLYMTLSNLVELSKDSIGEHVINVVSWRNQDTQGFYAKLVKDFSSKVDSISSQFSNFNQFQKLNSIRLGLQYNKLPSYLDKKITQNTFQQTLQFIKKQTIQELTQKKDRYNIQITKSFVVQQISEGSKTIITAELESTIFANYLYNEQNTFFQKSTVLLYFAPLVEVMPDGNNNYKSSSSDETLKSLIKFIKDKNIYKEPLPVNLPPTNQNWQHSIYHQIKIYVNQTKQVIPKLEVIAKKPEKILGKGPLTVQLKWDQEPDVDLHIFQPSGKQVYYSSKQGQNGYLDLDDTDGYGPEHYFALQDKLKPGNYIFKLNYFRGASRTKTVVTVSAGYDYFTKQLSLYPALGGGGNANPPYHICTVKIQQSRTDVKKFQYKIIP